MLYEKRRPFRAAKESEERFLTEDAEKVMKNEMLRQNGTRLKTRRKNQAKKKVASR